MLSAHSLVILSEFPAHKLMLFNADVCPRLSISIIRHQQKLSFLILIVSISFKPHSLTLLYIMTRKLSEICPWDLNVIGNACRRIKSRRLPINDTAKEVAALFRRLDRAIYIWP